MLRCQSRRPQVAALQDAAAGAPPARAPLPLPLPHPSQAVPEAAVGRLLAELGQPQATARAAGAAPTAAGPGPWVERAAC